MAWIGGVLWKRWLVLDSVHAASSGSVEFFPASEWIRFNVGLYRYKLPATDPFQLIWKCLILHDSCEIVPKFVHKILITGDITGEVDCPQRD